MPFSNGKKRGVFSPLYGRIAPRSVRLVIPPFRGIRPSYFPESGTSERDRFPTLASPSLVSPSLASSLISPTILPKSAIPSSAAPSPSAPAQSPKSLPPSFPNSPDLPLPSLLQPDALSLHSRSPEKQAPTPSNNQ